MTTLDSLYAADTTLTAEELLAAHDAQPPEPRGSSPKTYVTYTLIGERTDLFGEDAGNVAGLLHDGLQAWCDAPDVSALAPGLPNRGYLAIVHGRMKGAVGLDLTSPKTPGLLSVLVSGIDAAHPPLLTAELAAALLSIGYVSPPVVTLADAERVIRQHQAALAIAPLDEAVSAATAERNDYDALLSLWIATGEGVMPTRGGGE